LFAKVRDFFLPLHFNYIIDMTVLEKKKYNVIRAIMNDTNTKRVAEIERLYNPEPCVYTAEELRASVMQRTRKFYDGNMELLPHDQIKRKLVV